MKDNKYIFGLDGGGSTINAVIFDEFGKTISSCFLNEGANLSVYKDLGVKRIINLIKDITKNLNIDLDQIIG